MNNDKIDEMTRPVKAADIDAAARRISGVAALTPLEECTRLSEETATKVLLKREDLQLVRSYKLRGAFNLMSQLTAGRAGRRGGVRQCRQPRAGRRVRLPRAGHQGPDLPAEHHARSRSGTGSCRTAPGWSSW